MSVWIVRSGEYSDYKIMAVFSSEEKARAYLPEAVENDRDIRGSWGIEEWPIDEAPAATVQVVFQCCLDFATGSKYEGLSYSCKELRPRDWSSGKWYKSFHRCCGYSVVSQEHADKIAVETRQAALRGI